LKHELDILKAWIANAYQGRYYTIRTFGGGRLVGKPKRKKSGAVEEESEIQGIRNCKREATER
jgi:hypothetical protein